MDKFSELKATAMSATPGPWAYEAYGDTGQYGVGVLLNENDEPQSGRQEQGEMLVVESVASLVNGVPNAAFIAAANPAVVLALLAELEAKDKRIAELEAEAKVWESAATKHLARAEEAEKRLATPVRLSCETHPRCRTQHAKDVRAAGFTAEGDE
ncbi:ead/Ea22-like family protein [Serratia marcescens]|uniref:ead/Ea22-like family protein n=1 Tax=Serratia marcescens TaxID=615 RepID=UPI000744ED0B|nr:ead/Ea22-like family protein [Serratia marcescens]MBN3904751.1 ead/Ea22-like family protein [Serratia marcescens]MBN3916304.1 ead/Ea22-like family protein [Serratia marcescens]MBN3921333.1 ead/Ea22-like family protein [Serratia marcescens]MBN3938048.1 ead/Ea22-like family protein [Serratia marcescens]MBN3957044.1 ead/Ea22-like family protein [Serratia marcescens]